MSPERRNIESKLLKERYNLIQQEIPYKSIKIHNTYLYVNNQLHGQQFFSLPLFLGSQALFSPIQNQLQLILALLHVLTLFHQPLMLLTFDSESTMSQLGDTNSGTIGNDTNVSNNYVCLWNSRSLVNKLTSFQSFVYSSKFNIFAITETWLSSSVFDNEILPSGFTIFRRDHGSRGGGVMLAIKDKIPSKLLNHLN